MTMRETALEIFREALKAISPVNLFRESVSLAQDALSVQGRSYSLRRDQKIHVYGSGKASVEAARAIEGILGDRISDGLVVSSYKESSLKNIEVFSSSHPIPTEKSIRAADLLIERLSKLSENDFFIYLLSGGSSSLVEKPAHTLTLNAMQKTVNLLLKSAAPIEEINIVRKHLSLVKGGRLGMITRAKGVVLIVSDVIGDRLDTIGSGPFYLDRSSYQDAQNILFKHGLWRFVPASVKSLVTKGIAGIVQETPKEQNGRIVHHIMGSNLFLLNRAREKAEALGVPAHIMSSRLRGEAREVAKVIVSIGEEIAATGRPFDPPICLIFGGETTVTVRGKGKGGRNQEMCLAALQEIRDNRDMAFLSAGSDGIDGSSGAAGAFVDCESYDKASSLGLDIDSYLRRNDSHTFFRKTGDLIITGPTGTNVMDIAMLFIGRAK